MSVTREVDGLLLNCFPGTHDNGSSLIIALEDRQVRLKDSNMLECSSGTHRMHSSFLYYFGDSLAGVISRCIMSPRLS